MGKSENIIELMISSKIYQEVYNSQVKGAADNE